MKGHYLVRAFTKLKTAHAIPWNLECICMQLLKGNYVGVMRGSVVPLKELPAEYCHTLHDFANI